MALKKFCPKCGGETDQLFDGLCRSCAGSDEEILVAPGKITAVTCACGRLQVKGLWKKYDTLDNLLRAAVLEKIIAKNGASITISYNRTKSGGSETIPVTVVARTGSKEVSRQIDFVVKGACCPACSRMYGNYYEAVIQVRAGSGMLGKILEFLEQETTRLAKSHELSFITRTEKTRGGADVYIGSVKAAKKIAKSAETIYKLSSKTSYTEHGTKDGRTIIRTTILLKEEAK